MGRPPRRVHKLTPQQRKEVYEAFEDYITHTDHPLPAEFVATDPTATKYWVTKHNLEDWPEFRDLCDRAYAKQEMHLVRAGMTNNQQTTMSIFLLKQHWLGYRDRFDNDITSKGEKITFMNTVPRPEKEDRKRGS